MSKKLVIIVPCFNEQEILEDTANTLLSILISLINENLINNSSQICFINDGSSDNTQNIIDNLCKNNANFSALKLTNNFGHQNALLAGLWEYNADIYISIDADLQDNPNAIFDMVKLSYQGFDVVYGIRQKRETDSFLKKYTAELFYKVMNLFGANIIHNHADYRLLSKKVVNRLKSYKEKNLFLRGLIPTLKEKSSFVYYERTKREKGETKYSIAKMYNLASAGMINFSNAPIRLIIFMGLFVLFSSFCLFILLFTNFLTYKPISLFLSIIALISFFNSLILISLGIIGEYIINILKEVKNRPSYEIETSININ
jgi:glycosyltransferase involved in cell wall biosynthesis